MDKDILNEVIEAEKAIQQCIEVEQAKLRSWLDQVKRELSEAVAREENNDRELMTQALEEAKRVAEAKAKQVVDDAATRTLRIEKLDNGTLTGIIIKRMPRILLE
jgi:vacuolar-type H+-ATPase subunit H